jgi:uncharacterized protein
MTGPGTDAPPDAESVRLAYQRRAAPWPYADLDPARLRAAGWRPTPIRDVVLKVHQRCNLACDYCYVYRHADQSWRDRPAVMPAEVWRAALAAVGRYVRRHDLPHIRLILHGGEPLLLGAARLDRLLSQARATLPDGCAVEFGLQTNGVLLDESIMDTLRRHRVRVGVSADGVATAHDRHRPDRGGRSTFTAVRRALDLLRRPENRHSYAGILCTVPVEADPIGTYQQLLAFEPPLVDFLLPHANWAYPPHRAEGSHTPHGDWLVAVFDRWYESASPTRVRLFDDIIGLVLGAAGGSEQIGLSPAALVVIESDGAIEQVDALKTAYPGAGGTGLSVRHDELDRVFEDPGVVARQLGVAALAESCRACPVHRICGGGHYAHRYRPGAGFRNPSVYCADLRRLIEHVRGRVEPDLIRMLEVAR